MTKKFTLMMLFLLLIGVASFSQTASLATVTASPGQNVPVALNVTGFTGIGSITFNIRFKPSVMTFTGISNPSLGVTFMAGVTDSTINIVWSSTTYQNFPDGKLLDLNFTYYGMTSSPLNFLGTCQVTQGTTTIYPTYTNGAVNMASVPQTATILAATASTGGTVSVPIQYMNMPNVGAITQKIHYDPTKLTFINVIGVGNLATGINYNANSTTGVITITWTTINPAGLGINWSANQFLLNFLYIGSTPASLDFMAGSLISTPAPVTNVPVSYTSGQVTLAAATATAVLTSPAPVNQGQDIEVPMVLSGFPVTGDPSGPTQAFTLTIPYDNPRLTFLGIKAPAPSGLVVSQASGVLTLAWSNPSATNINGTFLTLKFKYNGIGTAAINFGNGCVFNTNNAGSIGTVQVAYTGATVTPLPATANAKLGFVQANAGSNVLVPVNFELLPVSMGAVTLFITYDYNKLTFIDAQNNTYGANVKLDAATHVIKVAWNALVATDINGKFLDLRFTYNGSGGDCGAAVSFTDGCELANYPAAAIVPANWINGGVNLKFKVSGYLTYGNVASTPLNNCTVNLKSGATTVGTATTDAAGYYEIFAYNGSYTLQAVCTKPWGGVTNADLIRMRQHVLGNLLTGLPFKAGDVNASNTITNADIILVRQKILNPITVVFPVGDWVYDVPTVLLNCADQSVSFQGLCAGDVNASYVPAP